MERFRVKQAAFALPALAPQQVNACVFCPSVKLPTALACQVNAYVFCLVEKFPPNQDQRR